MAAGNLQFDWPVGNKDVNGSKLSARQFEHSLANSIRPPSRRNNSTKVDVGNVSLRNISHRFRRIVIISFSRERRSVLRSRRSLGTEKSSNSETRIPLYCIVFRNFYLKAVS